MDREFDIYFFHVLKNIENDVDSWKWIFYRPNRAFSEFPGIFGSEETFRNLQYIDENDGGAEEKCVSDIECIAIVKTKNVSRVILLNYLDLDKFELSDKKVTMLKIQNVTKYSNVDAFDAWTNLDRCCPKHGKTDTNKLLRSINDTMLRISCSIPTEEFLYKYVKRRKAVILVNCTKEWIAQTRWSFENLLNEKSGKLWWNCAFESQDSYVKPFENVFVLSGKVLTKIIERNGTISVFDEIGRRKHTIKRRKGINVPSDKMHLFSDYDKPVPVPRDYYEQAGILTDYQWIIISNKDTGRYGIIVLLLTISLAGTSLHTDPKLTSPWNSLLSGHKW